MRIITYATTLMLSISPLSSLGADSQSSCPESAQTYQDRYMKSSRTSDLACHKKALRRESSAGKSDTDCPKSAQFYENSYMRSSSSNDFLCYKRAMRRERGM